MLIAVISDLHLGSWHCRSGPLLSFLKTARFDRLILNGDVVDHLNFDSFPAEHLRLLDRLREIGRQRHLILILGNHDGAPDPLRSQVLPRYLGVPAHRQYAADVGSDTYSILHGDSLDLLWPAASRLAASWTAGLIDRAWPGLGREFKLSLRDRAAYRRVRAMALARAHNGGYRGVLVGHTHLAEDDSFGRERYLNTGSWVTHDNWFAEIDRGQLRLRRWAPA